MLQNDSVVRILFHKYSDTTFVRFLNRVEMDKVLQRSDTDLPQRLYLKGTRGYRHASSNYHFIRIVRLMFHLLMVYLLCGYGHGPLKYHFVRIVHHTGHICMVYLFCGYEHVSSN